MLASVTNQVYGGVDVEQPLVNQAIDATTGLVLRIVGVTGRLLNSRRKPDYLQSR